LELLSSEVSASRPVADAPIPAIGPPRGQRVGELPPAHLGGHPGLHTGVEERGSSRLWRVSTISRNPQMHPHPWIPGSQTKATTENPPTDDTTATVGKRDNMGEYRRRPRQPQASEGASLTGHQPGALGGKTRPRRRSSGAKIPCSTEQPRPGLLDPASGAHQKRQVKRR
jgi:hypothetical protein